jgi:glycosyltransferase involved in cell wall biosynthesis
MNKSLSIIIPVYNEAANIRPLMAALLPVLTQLSAYTCEIIFVDDGSSDRSVQAIEELMVTNSRIKLIEFSRNFGKELATTAGIHAATGDAAIMLDADLQHPPELIPEFIAKWESGAEIVIGVRRSNTKEGIIKRLGSKLYYSISNLISDTEILSNATDFRLIDRVVIDEFNKFSERERITRGLIDWLGFRRDTVSFIAPERRSGVASYNFSKLLGLAIKSFVSHSLFPLKLAGYAGVIIIIFSLPFGIFMFLSRYIFTNFYNFSGTAILAVILLFLIGIVLSCLGLIALYIANIHTEVINRPLYVIRKKK